MFKSRLTWTVPRPLSSHSLGILHAGLPIFATRASNLPDWQLLALRCTFAVVFGLSLCPLFIADMPAMVDYPNHLARMSVLAREGTLSANPFYKVIWGLYPNLAMDLIVPPMSRIIGVETAMRIFLLVSQILVVTGSIALEWAVKRQFRAAGLVAVMLLYSLPFAWGFVNFQFGLGLALWSIAAWIVFKHHAWSTRLPIHVVCAVTLFITHFFALGVYGVTIGLLELQRAWTERWRFRKLTAVGFKLALPALLLLTLMMVRGENVGGARTEWYAQFKLHWVMFVLNGYDSSLSALCAVVLLGVTFFAFRRGALEVQGVGRWIAIAFTLLYLCFPFRLLDTSYADIRIIVAAGLILPAFVTTPRPNRKLVLSVIGCVVAIAIVNVLHVVVVWRSYDKEYRALIGSFELIKRSATILIAHSGDAPDPPANFREYPMYQAPTLAVHYADAFVPMLFTHPGKQPVRARPAVEHIDIPQGGPVPIAALRAIAEAGAQEGLPSFVRRWNTEFDYLYVVGEPIPNPMPHFLEEIASGSRFVLYQIHKG